MIYKVLIGPFIFLIICISLLFYLYKRDKKKTNSDENIPSVIISFRAYYGLIILILAGLLGIIIKLVKYW